LDHALVYIVRLATGLTLGDRNLALNFFHGFGLACIWTELSFIVVQYLEVMLLTEKLKGKTETLLRRLRLGFRWLTVAIVTTCMLCFTLPCLIPSMDQTKAYWVLVIVGVIIYSALFYYFGIGVRNLLKSMQVSKSFYAGLLKRLDLFMIPWTFIVSSAVISCIIFLTVPVFSKNMYIMVHSLMILGQLLNSFALLSTTPSSSKEGDPAHPTGGTHTLESVLGSKKKENGAHSDSPSLHVTATDVFDVSSRGQSPPFTPILQDRAITVESPSLLPSSSGSVDSSPLVSSRSTDYLVQKGTLRGYEDPALGDSTKKMAAVDEVEMDRLTSSRSLNLLEPKIWNPYLQETESREGGSH